MKPKLSLNNNKCLKVSTTPNTVDMSANVYTNAAPLFTNAFGSQFRLNVSPRDGNKYVPCWTNVPAQKNNQTSNKTALQTHKITKNTSENKNLLPLLFLVPPPVMISQYGAKKPRHIYFLCQIPWLYGYIVTLLITNINDFFFFLTKQFS